MSPSPTLSVLASLAWICVFQPSSHAQAPVNDAFASPTIIIGDPTAAPVTATGTTINATKEANEPDHAFNAGGASIWFQWTAPSSAPVAIDLAGSGFDSIMAIYTGPSIGSLDLVIFNDESDHDAGIGVPSKAVFNSIAGTTYRIAIDGYLLNGTLIPPTGNVALSISAVTPPSNDSFSNPIDLAGTVPLVRSGDPHRNSTTENGEPPHGGVYGFGTTWYTWTAADSRAVEVAVDNGTTLPSLVAVYTGTSLTNLTEVSNAFSGSRALIPTSAGTTYRIAVVGVYVGAQPRGDIMLTIQKSDSRQVDSLGFGDRWQWLHPLDAVDPDSGDADFDATWHSPSAGYDGPAFAAASPAPLGYGTIAFAPLATDIGTPAPGARLSAYFVRNFTLASAIAQPSIELLADDGAVIYIDGSEAGRVNVTGADDYSLLADDAADTENRTYRVGIAPLAAGDHTIGVSLHNAATDSSDLGFDLRLHEGLPFTGEVALSGNRLCVGFQDSLVGYGLHLGRSNGNDLGWLADSAFTIEAPAGEHALEINNTTGARFETERVDVAGQSGIIASVDLRTVDTSSGFEATDFLHVFVEGSYDGLNFAPVADIFARLTGGTPDPFEPYRSDTSYTSFTTLPGDIPDGLISLRIIAEGTADSSSEHMILDNFCIESSGARVRILDFSADQDSGVSLTIQAEPDHLYIIQSSLDLGHAVAWTPLASQVAVTDRVTFSTAVPPGTSKMFYRVVDFGED